MWRRRRVSSYRGETIAEDPQETIPFDHDSWAARSSQPKSATATSSLFENRSGGSQPQQLVGYRVIRMLGRGTRATVYLGHRPATPAAPALRAIDHDSGPLEVSADEPGHTRSATAEFDELVALKLFHSATGQASIDLEVRVLTASAGQHVLGLTDIATTPSGGVVLVLPYLSGGTLAQLLERRGRLLPGEAVNILVPIVTAVTRLYRSGFRHISLSSTRVMFEARGTPVVAGIGRARAIQAAAGTEAASPVGLGEESEIWASVAALADEVLARVRPDESDGTWLSLKAGLAGHDSASALVRATEHFTAELFDWADPQAVAQNDPDPQLGPSNRAPSRIPGRTHRAPDDRATRGDSAALSDGAARSEQTGQGEQPIPVPVERSWLGVFHLPTQVRDSVERALDLNPVHMLKDTWRSVPGRTRHMLVAGGLVFALLAAVLLAIPSHSQTVDSNQDAGGMHGAVIGTSAVDAGILSQPADAGDSDQIISAADRSKILAADPLVAGEVLLVARQSCLRERSMVCLLEVVQENTALMDADRARLRDLAVGHGATTEDAIAAESPVGPQTHTATLVERSGDTALILWEPRVAHENQPVSVLMMRAETGWRLREFFDY